MTTYIILLRGVNVGGNNKVPMSVLKENLINLGYNQVITYINSGNALFCSPKPKETLVGEIKEMLKSSFHFNIDFVLLTKEQLHEAYARAPEWWGVLENAKHNAIFVLDNGSSQDIITQVGEMKPEYEKLGYHGNVIFWSADIKNFSKTRWSKIVGTNAYQMITIRNYNTFQKLVELSLKNL